MHDLYLDIKDTINLATMRVDDISVYFSNAPKENCILEVTPPTHTYPTLALRFEPGFSVVLNSSNLRIAPVSGGVKSDLPDGNYFIKYSVAPNQSVYVAYNYFRNLKQLKSYGELLCSMRLNKCNIPTRDFYELRKEILILKQDIDGAKFLAENKFMLKEALAVYNDNDKQLDLIKKKVEWYQK